MTEEIWRPTGYDVLEASNFGRLRSNRTGRIRVYKPTCNGRGYMRINYKKNKKQNTLYVHRLVAQAFLDKPKDKDDINHKDGNKSNNAPSNLEWVTPLENIHHALETGLRVLKKTPCIRLSLDGKWMGWYESYCKAAEMNNCFMGGIRNVCIGKHPTYKGFKWRIADVD